MADGDRVAILQENSILNETPTQSPTVTEFSFEALILVVMVMVAVAFCAVESLFRARKQHALKS